MTKTVQGRRVKCTKTRKGWWLEDKGVVERDKTADREREREGVVEEESVFEAVVWVQACFVRQSEVVISR